MWWRRKQEMSLPSIWLLTSHWLFKISLKYTQGKEKWCSKKHWSSLKPWNNQREQKILWQIQGKMKWIDQRAALIAVWSKRCNFLISLRWAFIRLENLMRSMKTIDQRLLAFPPLKIIIKAWNPKPNNYLAFQDQGLQVNTAPTIQLVLIFRDLPLTSPTQKSLPKTP